MPRACGKIVYASQRDANTQISYVAGRKHRDRQRRRSMHAYRCRVCGQWHIGAEMFMPPPRQMILSGAAYELDDGDDAMEA
jgi:hypothetical protein